MKGRKSLKNKEHSPEKSPTDKNKKSSVIFEGDGGTTSELKSDFSLSMTKNFEKIDSDVISKSSEETLMKN